MGFFSNFFGGDADDDSQDSAEYIELRDAASAHLQVLTQGHVESWNLGSAQRWDFDQEDGSLLFTFDDLVATCPAQIVGSFNADKGSWLWSWANPSILEPLTQDALRVREYGEQHGFAKLTDEKWEGSEEDAWGAAAIATKVCERQGVYRGPAVPMLIFFTFGEVRLTSRNTDEN